MFQDVPESDLQIVAEHGGILGLGRGWAGKGYNRAEIFIPAFICYF